MFATFFAWHREDRNLCSINYMHAGAPKMWLAVPFKHASRFEDVLQTEINKIPNAIKKANNLNCNLLVRHKVIHAPPSFLVKNKIPFGKVNFI